MSSDTPAEDQPPAVPAEDQPASAPAEPSAPQAAANAGPPSDDPPPDAVLAAIVEANAMADALKAVSGAVEDMRSPAPDKRDARNKVRDDYAKAFDDLERKYKDANDRFVRAAADMLRKGAGERSRLETWIDRWLKGDKDSLLALLYDRRQVRDRLDARAGPRERARDLAAARAKIWQDTFAGWGAAPTRIAALINDYGPRIDKLNAQINTDVDADLAIYSFWFEVAPSHLQLRADPVSAANAPGVDLLMAALASFDDELDALKAGPDRRGGSLYLIAPGGLADKRDAAMTAWRDAAKDQGTADAAYKLRPDSAAALKARADAQQQNRAADAKALLLKPTN